jgi:S-adenosylmethionine decarboxylase
MLQIPIPKHYTESPSSYAGTPQVTINHEATVDLDSTNAFEGKHVPIVLSCISSARSGRIWHGKFQTLDEIPFFGPTYSIHSELTSAVGPEKLLEVWFAPSVEALPDSCPTNGLKTVPADTWKEMLDLVHCSVLSIVESEHVDAYLLSESSMFVFPHKVVLKTCGTTTLLYGLPRMLEIAALMAGFPHVPADPANAIQATATPYRVFYSRKNFLYPNQQRGPHRSWRDEVRFLDKLFLGGSAYMIGKMNGEHWYLYITGPDTQLTPPSTPSDSSPTETKFVVYPEACKITNQAAAEDDETLELLMTDLDETCARQFYLEDASAVADGHHLQKAHEARKTAIKGDGSGSNGAQVNAAVADSTFDVFGQTSSDHSDVSASDDDTLPGDLATEGHTLGTIVSDSCGLSDVYPLSKYPDGRIDAYLFTPCGFSANGVIPAPPGTVTKGGKSTHYFTVHVTPEPQCSYASFETNIPACQSGRETADIVEQVVKIFRPGRFSVTQFEASPHGDDASALNNVAKKSKRMDSLKGYRRIDRIVHDLDGYELVFRYYERNDWKGGAPRLGEIF